MYRTLFAGLFLSLFVTAVSGDETTTRPPTIQVHPGGTGRPTNGRFGGNPYVRAYKQNNVQRFNQFNPQFNQFNQLNAAQLRQLQLQQQQLQQLQLQQFLLQRGGFGISTGGFSTGGFYNGSGFTGQNGFSTGGGFSNHSSGSYSNGRRSIYTTPFESGRWGR